MIVTAYAEGDRRTLKNLLARDVYDGFDAVIKERETRGETAETRFVSIDSTDIIGAEVLEGNQPGGERRFRFFKGPVFANLVLADEFRAMEGIRSVGVVFSGGNVSLDKLYW